jgi:exosortase
MSVQVIASARAPIARQGTTKVIIVVVTIVTATCLLVYGPVLYKLFHDWWTLPDFSHGFFVPLFSTFVIWQQRARLAEMPLRPSWSGLAILAVAMSMLVAGQLGAELFVSRVSLIMTIAGLVVLFGGWDLFRALLFPWAFLFLMIPIPAILFNQITFPLQLLASKIAAALLPLANVPVLREGNIINIPAMPLEVAEACSGIRSLMTLGTLAVMYSYLAEKVMWRRVALVLASVPIAVLANSGRVVGTGLCVQYWNPDKALGFFHEFSGWAIFMVSLVMLYIVHVGLCLIGRKNA